MKKLLLFTLLLLFMVGIVYAFKSKNDFLRKLEVDNFSKSEESKSQLQDGDIIFQSSKTGQSLAIQLATESIYSHCGIVFLDNGVPMVLEAVQPVQIAPLLEWVKYGDDEKYYVKRLKDKSLLTSEVIDKMKSIGSKWIGKNYDIYFNWSDKDIYCSELVYKIYEQSLGIKLGKIKVLKDYDLTHPAVRKIMKERYGDNIPENEPMISPGAIYESDALETIIE